MPAIMSSRDTNCLRSICSLHHIRNRKVVTNGINVRLRIAVHVADEVTGCNSATNRLKAAFRSIAARGGLTKKYPMSKIANQLYAVCMISSGVHTSVGCLQVCMRTKAPAANNRSTPICSRFAWLNSTTGLVANQLRVVTAKATIDVFTHRGTQVFSILKGKLRPNAAEKM